MATQLPTDPGNIFESDYHRRLLAHLPKPDEDPMAVDSLFYRMLRDEGFPEEGLEELIQTILSDLVNGDHAESAGDGGFRMTETGLNDLNGPVLVRREIVQAGGIDVVYVEDPPMEGKPLKRAEEINAERTEEDEKIVADAKAARKAELEEELAAMEDES